MYHARNVVDAAKVASGQEQQEIKALHDGPTTKLWQENWYDGLTYCKYKNLLPPYVAEGSRYLECPGTASE